MVAPYFYAQLAMTPDKAVNELMKEFNAPESFRGYFERKVYEWLGTAKSVLSNDLVGIRDSIRRDR